MDGRIEADALEQRVLAFTAIHSGVALRKLTPLMRLAQDLDVKGEDASEFFTAFGTEFRVNLDELNMHWDRHFHPEAGLLLNTVLVALACVTLASCLLVLLNFGGWFWSYDYVSPYQIYRGPLCVGSGLASLIFWIVAWHQNRISIPITIADLIDAADAGRWVKSYGARG
jgi:Protein of unknown function (DUF1493)